MSRPTQHPSLSPRLKRLQSLQRAYLSAEGRIDFGEKVFCVLIKSGDGP